MIEEREGIMHKAKDIERKGESCAIRNLHGKIVRDIKKRVQGVRRREGEKESAMKESYVLGEGGCLFYFW